MHPAVRGNLHYKVKKVSWRSEELRKFLRIMDYCYAESRARESSVTGVYYTKGSPPRVRIDSDEVSSSDKCVYGLPVNCYNAQWLEDRERGWAAGGTGYVNTFVCPSRKKFSLECPDDLKR